MCLNLNPILLVSRVRQRRALQAEAALANQNPKIPEKFMTPKAKIITAEARGSVFSARPLLDGEVFSLYNYKCEVDYLQSDKR